MIDDSLDFLQQMGEECISIDFLSDAEFMEKLEKFGTTKQDILDIEPQLKEQICQLRSLAKKAFAAQLRAEASRQLRLLERTLAAARS